MIRTYKTLRGSQIDFCCLLMVINIKKSTENDLQSIAYITGASSTTTAKTMQLIRYTRGANSTTTETEMATVCNTSTADRDHEFQTKRQHTLEHPMVATPSPPQILHYSPRSRWGESFIPARRPGMAIPAQIGS